MPRLSALLVLAVLAACASPDAPEAPAAPAPAAAAVIEGKVASADGVPIAYSAEGDGEVAVVLIHGWSCDRTYWRRQIEPLIAASYRVVSLDLAGHGASGLERAEWTLAAFGEDVKAVVEALGLARVVLVGHSMGAPVALEAAPLLAAEVLGVVAVDSLHDVDSKPDPERWRGVIESYETDFAGTCSGFVRSMFLDAADPELVESTTADMCAAPREIATALMRAFGAYDAAVAMRSAGVPVRAINSAVYPTDLEGNREHGDYEVRILEGVGHFPMLVVPEELSRLLLEVLAELTG